MLNNTRNILQKLKTKAVHNLTNISNLKYKSTSFNYGPLPESLRASIRPGTIFNDGTLFALNSHEQHFIDGRLKKGFLAPNPIKHQQRTPKNDYLHQVWKKK